MQAFKTNTWRDDHTPEIHPILQVNSDRLDFLAAVPGGTSCTLADTFNPAVVIRQVVIISLKTPYSIPVVAEAERKVVICLLTLDGQVGHGIVSVGRVVTIVMSQTQYARLAASQDAVSD